jgi:hypothetical protein
MSTLAKMMWSTICCATVISAGPIKLLKIQLKVDRFGPIKIGMTPKEVSKIIGIPVIPYDSLEGDDSSCFFVSPNGYSKDIVFMIENGRITRIDVTSKNISVAGKIHIGDDEKKVTDMFKEKVQEAEHPYIGKDGKYLTVFTKPGFAFLFETEKGKIISFRSGDSASVKYIEGCH